MYVYATEGSTVVSGDIVRPWRSQWTAYVGVDYSYSKIGVAKLLSRHFSN